RRRTLPVTSRVFPQTRAISLEYVQNTGKGVGETTEKELHDADRDGCSAPVVSKCESKFAKDGHSEKTPDNVTGGSDRFPSPRLNGCTVPRDKIHYLPVANFLCRHGLGLPVNPSLNIHPSRRPLHHPPPNLNRFVHRTPTTATANDKKN
ncbi:hypothetical protein BaRGS_00004018, partial [Batillaria attramentaria]